MGPHLNEHGLCGIEDAEEVAAANVEGEPSGEDMRELEVEDVEQDEVRLPRVPHDPGRPI